MIWFPYDCFSKSKERFELETHHHRSRAIDLTFPQASLSLTASSYSFVYIIYKDVKCMTKVTTIPSMRAVVDYAFWLQKRLYLLKFAYK